MKALPSLANLDRIHGGTPIEHVERGPYEHFPLFNISHIFA